MTSVYSKIFEQYGLSKSQEKIIDLVGSSKKVLELGCSSGYMSKLLKENNCQVDGLEIDRKSAEQAKKYLNKLFIGSLDEEMFLKKIKEKYDVIVAADVLEHTKNPEVVLKSLRKNLKEEGRFIISLPNIACWQMRKNLFLKGDFSYQDSGILDKTHLRFYTFFTIQELVKKSQLKVTDIFSAILSFPFKNSLAKISPAFSQKIGNILNRRYPNLVTFHLVLVAKRND